MDNLTMDLVRLTRRNHDGSIGTQKNRQRGLTAMADDLKQLGFTLKTARSLKPKHVAALVGHWQDRGLTKATLRNRMSWLRWWAEKIDKISMLPKDNAAFELNDARHNDNNRALTVSDSQLAAITDACVRASVMLQAAFGLRREEAMKIIPSEGFKQDCVRLKGSWCKNGRPRTIPVTTQQQRLVMDAVRQLTPTGSLIPADRTYVQHLRVYERLTQKAGLGRSHGLRHAYAQARYEKLTGMKCPLNGGPDRTLMSEAQFELDRQARARIAKELGHQRIEICAVYLGHLSDGGAALCSPA